MLQLMKKPKKMMMKNGDNMSIFKIISMENFDSIYGEIKKGDEINSVEYETLNECKNFVRNQYGPKGENIKVKIIEVKQ